MHSNSGRHVHSLLAPPKVVLIGLSAMGPVTVWFVCWCLPISCVVICMHARCPVYVQAVCHAWISLILYCIQGIKALLGCKQEESRRCIVAHAVTFVQHVPLAIAACGIHTCAPCHKPMCCRSAQQFKKKAGRDECSCTRASHALGVPARLAGPANLVVVHRDVRCWGCAALYIISPLQAGLRRRWRMPALAAGPPRGAA